MLYPVDASCFRAYHARHSKRVALRMGTRTFLGALCRRHHKEGTLLKSRRYVSSSVCMACARVLYARRRDAARQGAR